MTPYTYALQNFKNQSQLGNISVYYDGNKIDFGASQSSQNNYFKITPYLNTDNWVMDNEQVDPVQLDYIINSEGLSPSFLQPSNILYSNQQGEKYVIDFSDNQVPVYDLYGTLYIQLDFSINLEEIVITAQNSNLAQNRPSLRAPRARNQLNAGGATISLFISSDGAKLQRAFKSITDIAKNQILLLLETEDLYNVFSVIRIKTGQFIGASPQGLPTGKIKSVLQKFQFKETPNYFLDSIRKHYQEKRDGIKGSIFFLQGRELYSILLLFSIKRFTIESRKVKNSATFISDLKLDDTYWDSSHKHYKPIIPSLDTDTALDANEIEKIVSDLLSPLTKNIVNANKNLSTFVLYKTAYKPLVDTILLNINTLPKTIANMISVGLASSEITFSAYQAYLNAQLVGIINSVIDFIAGIFQLIGLILDVILLSLQAQASFLNDPAYTLSLYYETLENVYEFLDKTFTVSNFAILVARLTSSYLKFQDVLLEKTTSGSEEDAKQLASYTGYYSGYILGLIVEEVVLAYVTAGIGNLAKASAKAVSNTNSMI